jgi:hypothetical protein
LKIVVFNIGWMNEYLGQNSADQVVYKGIQGQSKLAGYEQFNFLESGGNVCGFVEPPSQAFGKGAATTDKQIDLQKIDSAAVDSVDDVLVVWSAPNIAAKGRVVVGWYEHATVYRSFQFGNEPYGYYVRAKASDAFLLHADERFFLIPQGKGWAGQTNVWFMDNTDNPGLDTFKEQLTAYIETCKDKRAHGVSLSITAPVEAKPAQASVDRKRAAFHTNAAVADKALSVVMDKFRNQGYVVVQTEPDFLGWELEAVKDQEKLCIGVKGVAGDDVMVELSPYEYKNLLDKRRDYRLVIVSGCLSEEQRVQIFSYHPAIYRWDSDEGKILRIEEKKAARCFAR